MRCAWVRSCCGLLDRLLEAAAATNRAGSPGSRLVDQHLGLVLQARDLVVDLLQLARRGQHILREVGRDRRRSIARGRERRRRRATRAASAGGERRGGNGRGSWGSLLAARLVSMSAAQSRPLRAQPGGGEAVAAMRGERSRRWRPGRSSRTRRRRRARPRSGPARTGGCRGATGSNSRASASRGEDLDLAIVEAEAAIDGRDLRLDRALVRQEERASGSSR